MEYMGVSLNGGIYPKMDGENNGKPLLKWMIWGVPSFLETLSYMYHIPFDPQGHYMSLSSSEIRPHENYTRDDETNIRR